jgi:CubicO group peptidase (beta-lactamase class C family)
MIEAERLVRATLGTRYTAAVLRVDVRGTLAFERAFGTLDDKPGARATDVTTAFDLASLTKVFVATAALRAVAAGALSLDGSLTALVPEWRGTAHEAITLRDLLAHRSGMASGADYRTLFNEDVALFACTRPLVAPPHERVIYSDLGFITLGVVLARSYGMSLSTTMAATLGALRCDGTGYRARNDDPLAVPATECDAWRGRVRGAVHDEKAYLMGGVAGHAGLFGTAIDVARLAEAYLAPLHGRSSPALPESLAIEAIAEHGADPVLRRGLGWALKTSDENSCGSLMSPNTFGHTGFTGTVVWADPVRDLSIVFFTNGVYFGRSDLREVRAAVCDAVVREFAP